MTTEFREHLTKHGIWPLGKLYLDHMREHHGGVSGKALTDLRAGAAVTEKAAHGLITFMLECEFAAPGSRESLLGFIEAKGLTKAADHNEILAIIAGPPRETRAPADGSADYLHLGTRAGVDMILHPRKLITRRSRACGESEITEAIGWLHVLIAYSLASKKTRDTMTVEQARPIAEAHMGVGLDAYADRMKAWRERLPLTVRLAMGRRHPVGVTVVLPLTPEAYEAVRCGQRASYECGPDDILDTSRHLLIEVGAERVAGVRVEPVNPTLPVLTSLLFQLAHLSGIRDRSDDTNIRLLSFAGTEDSRARLAKQGFEPTTPNGAIMPRSGVEILEREFLVGSLAGLSAVTVMVLRWIARSTPPE